MTEVTQYLNEETLMRLLRERIKNSQCPLCETDSWSLHVPAGATGVALPWSTGDSFFMSGSPAALLTCKCCGYIRLHSLSVLSEALETLITVGPSQGADDNGR